jgi:trk system potassium uptake protein TrkA
MEDFMFGINKSMRKGLNILIIGCGKVGRTLVEQLCLEGHDITVIDKDPKKLRLVGDLNDVMGI